MDYPELDEGAPFDWGRASADYAKYRDIYPEEFYRRLLNLGLCDRGQDVLDLGTGTGVLPRNLYRHGARFTGTDPSEEQIGQARALAGRYGMKIRFEVAGAESAAFPDAAFDVVTACQCHIYFDRIAALPNIRRMLREGGRFCVLWMAWLPGEDPVAGASEALVQRHNPAWSGGGYRRGDGDVPGWAAPWFRLEQAEAYDVAVPFTRQSWHGRILACRGIGASSLTAAAIRRFGEAHTEMLRGFPEAFQVLHHVTMHVFTKADGGSASIPAKLR